MENQKCKAIGSSKIPNSFSFHHSSPILFLAAASTSPEGCGLPSKVMQTVSKAIINTKAELHEFAEQTATKSQSEITPLIRNKIIREESMYFGKSGKFTHLALTYILLCIGPAKFDAILEEKGFKGIEPIYQKYLNENFNLMHNNIDIIGEQIVPKGIIIEY